MEVLKDISQLTKGCGVTFIKNDKFHFYEYLMVHPNCGECKLNCVKLLLL